jgi:hypothetical protein
VNYYKGSADNERHEARERVTRFIRRHLSEGANARIISNPRSVFLVVWRQEVVEGSTTPVQRHKRKVRRPRAASLHLLALRTPITFAYHSQPLLIIWDTIVADNYLHCLLYISDHVGADGAAVGEKTGLHQLHSG